MNERVEELHRVAVFDRVFSGALVLQHFVDPGWIERVLTGLIQDFNLVVGSLLVVTCTLLELKSDVGVMRCVSCEPDCTEVAPA